jgi:hypothetical protein
MKRRHVGAIASLLLLAGCGPDMTALNGATRKAAASAERAEKAAKIAEASAQEALNVASRVNSMADAAENEVRRANDALSRTEMFYEATHPGSGVVSSKISAIQKPWLLLVPPHFVGVHDPMDGLPFSQWFGVDDFDSARECKRAKAAQIEAARRYLDIETKTGLEPSNIEESRLRYQSMLSARCVARTDPRRESD